MATNAKYYAKTKGRNPLPSSLSVASWNVNGLKGKEINKDDDPDFRTLIRKHHIVCLSETHVGKDHNLKIEGFKTLETKARPVCKSNNKYYGGLILLVRDEILDGVTVIETFSEESIIIKADKKFFGLKNDLFISFLYIVPSNSTYNSKLVNDVDPMDELEKTILGHSMYGDLLIMGDLNSRTARRPDFIVGDEVHVNDDDFYEVDQTTNDRCSYDENVNSHGLKLLEMCQGHKLRILNGRTLGDLDGKFTCHRPNGSSVVDYGLCKEESMYLVNLFTVHEYNGHLSDHCMISTSIRNNQPMNPHKHVINKAKNNKDSVRDFVSFKWDSENDPQSYYNELISSKFQKRLDQLGTSIDSKSCNETVKNLSDLLIEVANSSISRKLKKKSKKRKAYKKWYTADCEAARKRIKYLAKQLHKHPFDKQIREDFFRHKKIYKKLLKRQKISFKQDCIKKLENLVASNPKEYWKLLNNLKKDEHNNKEQEYIPLQSWVEHFQKLHNNGVDDPALNLLLEAEEARPYFSELDFRISEKEVRDVIKNLKPNKAAGHDKILGEMIKAGQEVLIPILAKLFNQILQSKEYPHEWNKGIISPIHKKGSKYNPDNYRGITVNSVVAKIYSMVLCNRLEEFTDRHNTLHDTQIGFKKNSQTSDHILVMQTLMEKYINKGNLHVCFIDFRKAYDSVWRQALLYKLQKQNIRGLFYNQIKSMYNNVQVCIKQNGQLSNFFESKMGVKQGEVLSPLLFNLFINDINDCFDDACDPVLLNNRKLSCLQYADDLILLSESRVGMQTCLDSLHEYCRRWKLDINTDKSKVMTINKQGGRKKVMTTLTFGDTPLEYVNNYTYLGIKITNNGKFTTCKENLSERGRKAMYKLKGLISCTDINKSLALKMFDQLVSPILTYGCETWGPLDFIKLYSPKDTKILEQFYSNLTQEKLNIHFCKYILGVSTKSTNVAVMAELGRYPIGVTIVTQMIKYYLRILDMPVNSLLRDTILEMRSSTTRGCHPWLKSVEYIFATLGLDLSMFEHYVNTSTYKRQKISKSIRSQLEGRYDHFWKRLMCKQDGKLNMYKEIKTNFQYETYLDCIRSSQHQKQLTKLRISNHKLYIETGRYQKPYVERKDRLCQLCASNEVEDEYHFLFKCQKLKDIRLKNFGGPEIKGSRNTLLKEYLSNFATVQIKVVVAYIHEALECRERILDT
jgi:hypothetical protein